MPKVTNEYIKSQKPWIKIAMKGRPLWFGLQAAGLEGLFRISKKKAEVAKQKLVDGKPFDETGKTGKEGEKANKDGLDGKAAMGVCQGGNGVLKLFVVKGGLTEGHLKFARIFISKQLKVKSVKKVELAEVADETKLPMVPDKDPKDSEKATAGALAGRVTALQGRLAKAGGSEAVTRKLDAANAAVKSDPDSAEDQLDEVDAAISVLEAARTVKDPKVLPAVQEKLKAWDLDGAEALVEAAGGKVGDVAPDTKGPPVGDGKLAAAKKTWETASAAVDKQLSDLQGVMRKHADEQVREIAEFGLTGVDGGIRAQLKTVLAEVEGAGDAGARKKATAAAQKVIAELGKHVGKDERVKVCDDNPFGAKVQIKETINAALKELATALK